jgi:hypothetical protein
MDTNNQMKKRPKAAAPTGRKLAEQPKKPERPSARSDQFHALYYRAWQKSYENRNRRVYP